MNESPLPGQEVKIAALENYEAIDDGDRPTVDLGRANIITSKIAGSEKHKVVLDIDFPAKLVPSSTEGHFHLYIDHELSWDEYLRLLWVLADIGLVEEGYASSSQERGYTSLRLPWIKKKEENV